MKPIKEGRIGGSTGSNAFTHTDYVKVSKKLNEVVDFYDEKIFLGIWRPPRHHPG